MILRSTSLLATCCAAVFFSCAAISSGQTTPPNQTPPRNQNPPGDQKPVQLPPGATPAPKVSTPDVKIPGPLSLPGPSTSEIGAQPLTVSEAVSVALRRQPQVNIARADILSQQGRVQQAAAGLLPQLSATASYNNSISIHNLPPSPSPWSTGVSLQQLLFDFGRTRDTVRQQSALERSSEWNLTRTQQTTAMQVRNAYYNLAQALANVQLSIADVNTRQKELDQANARMNNGLGPPSDVLTAKTSLADGAVSLSTARDQALTAQVALAQLMGINPRTPITTAAASELPVADEDDLEKLMTQAMNGRPDIKALKEQVSAAGFAVSSASKGNLPRVDFNGGYVGRGANDPFEAQGATYGISVTWLFGDGGLTAGQVKEARGNEESARQNLISGTNQAIADVSQAFVDLQSANQRLDLAKVGVANAVELVRVNEGRYTGGIGQFLDVTTAQTSLINAEHSMTQAQGDVDRARANLRSAIGLL